MDLKYYLVSCLQLPQNTVYYISGSSELGKIGEFMKNCCRCLWIFGVIYTLGIWGGSAYYFHSQARQMEEEFKLAHIARRLELGETSFILRAAPFLEKLLASHEARGYAVLDLEDALASNRPDYNDNSFRNSQLKEIYLAKALAACDPESNTAREIISEYARGMNGIFSIFAAAKHN